MTWRGKMIATSRGVRKLEKGEGPDLVGDVK